MPRLEHIDFVWSDGGRSQGGFKGTTGDCVVRAIAIALDLDYRPVYEEIRSMLQEEARKAKTRGKKPDSGSPRDGVPMEITKRYLDKAGWEWVPVMGIGTGCTMHVRRGELPMGRVILRLSGHMAAAIDGVLHDTWDCSRDGTRCVYGFWRQKEPCTILQAGIDA